MTLQYVLHKVLQWAGAQLFMELLISNTSDKYLQFGQKKHKDFLTVEV